jgi:hypothetical protein
VRTNFGGSVRQYDGRHFTGGSGGYWWFRRPFPRASTAGAGSGRRSERAEDGRDRRAADAGRAGHCVDLPARIGAGQAADGHRRSPAARTSLGTIAMPIPRAMRLRIVPRPSNSHGTGGGVPSTAASSWSTACRDDSPSGPRHPGLVPQLLQSDGPRTAGRTVRTRHDQHQRVAGQVIQGQDAVTDGGVPSTPVIDDGHVDLTRPDLAQAHLAGRLAHLNLCLRNQRLP